MISSFGETMKKIATFDDWIDSFRSWQKDIDLRLPKYADYVFEAKYGDLRTEDRLRRLLRRKEMGESRRSAPAIRDALLNLIVYQGDTGCQRRAAAPVRRRLPDYDTDSVCRIARKCATAGRCTTAGQPLQRAGKIEARSSSAPLVANTGCSAPSTWTWTTGWTSSAHRVRRPRREVQLNMLSTSGFAPLALDGADAARGGFHLGTGHMGLQRIAGPGESPGMMQSTSASGSRRPTTSSAGSRLRPVVLRGA
jgi:hypothetical protein